MQMQRCPRFVPEEEFLSGKKRKGLAATRGPKGYCGNAAQAPPVGLEITSKSQGKRKKVGSEEAKWEARGVTVAEWRELPAAAKAFLLAVVQTVGRGK
jgi:hypothetical protein